MNAEVSVELLKPVFAGLLLPMLLLSACTRSADSEQFDSGTLPSTSLSAGQFDSGTLPSTNLSADLKAMWETKRIGGAGTGVAAEHRFASTYDAINAASRVFNTIDLKGMDREQVIAKLGDPTSSNNSTYNFPFYPAKPGDLVYRFDAGNGGWQFNIHFDAQGHVSAIERLGIE